MKADDRNLLCGSGLNGPILFLSKYLNLFYSFFFGFVFFKKNNTLPNCVFVNFFLSCKWNISHWYRKLD